MSFRHILVATDGSALSDKAFGVAAALARSTGARLTAVHAVAREIPTDMSFLAEANLRDRDKGPASPSPEASAIQEKVAALARAAGLECPLVVEEGEPWEAIVRVAEERDCDLIAMGTHGREGMGAMLIGSQTQKVLAHTKRPVLACP